MLRRLGLLLPLVVLIRVTVLPSSAHATEERSSPTPPLIHARAAVLIEADTGRVLFQQNAHERLPPASLTKMATALVALERVTPDFVVVATEHTLAEPSVIGLEPGDRLPLREALYGLLLNSGNDAALAIAESVGQGSIARFVGWMNDLVIALGLRDTRFANPHGLDVGEHYSSAYDMAIIGRVLLRDPLLRSIVATRDHSYPGPPLWAFHNINRFLGAYPGADGIKTGYEVRAGSCMAASATRSGKQLISVVLNSPQTVQDSSALLDYGFALLAQENLPAEQEPWLGPGRLERVLAHDRSLMASSGIQDAYVIELAAPHAGSRSARLPTASVSVYDRLQETGTHGGVR